jgi:hypothetical protein
LQEAQYKRTSRSAAEAALVDYMNGNWVDEMGDEPPADEDGLARHFEDCPGMVRDNGGRVVSLPLTTSGIFVFQKADEAPFIVGPAQLTFPQHESSPSVRPKDFQVFGVPRSVPTDLGGPIFHVRLRHPRTSRAIVTVPKTAVNEDHLAARWKDQIGAARQIPPVETIPKASGMQ